MSFSAPWMNRRERLDRKCKSNLRSRNTADSTAAPSSPGSSIGGISDTTLLPASSVYSSSVRTLSPPCSVGHTPFVSDQSPPELSSPVSLKKPHLC